MMVRKNSERKTEKPMNQKKKGLRERERMGPLWSAAKPLRTMSEETRRPRIQWGKKKREG